MGLDARDIDSDKLDGLPEYLRTCGMEVTVSDAKASHARSPHLLRVKKLHCSRNGATIVLYLETVLTSPNISRIYIPCLWSWWPPAARRRQRLERDVTHLLEEYGARRL
jgi:hypothetical protein